MESEEIINRVANSVLEVFDLEDYYPKGPRVEVDLAQWLFEGFLLREKDFRESLKNHNWGQYKDAYVAVFCSTDAILPAWASVLVTMHLAPFAKRIISGRIDDVNPVLYEEILGNLDYSAYADKPVIIKGCMKKPIPMSAYVLAAQKLQPVAKSVMYGEACSAVPLYKRK
ncbi:DUF2480 family protein [Flavobacterium selenitireducens]|uniref:DUF2480 family protein n=1 Tax=Flavobacterium selenitireducens TaxID=2722704 RepID=UPI00168B6BCD|nr:DUF2480 family protein [Flavobacterium selenitireducens]MBD3583722.1 DUF2480 family protein [Flavobacterium selenitireducens]